jgi:hypothetical protein
MFQYPVFGNPWQPSAALGAPNQAVSGGLCPTSQDPLDSVRELFSGFKDSMKAEFSSLSSRLSVLESSTKVRVDPVPPSPESQEDEVDREEDEISVAPGSQERVFLDEEESDHPLQVLQILIKQSLMVLLFLRLTVLLFLKRT